MDKSIEAAVREYRGRATGRKLPAGVFRRGRWRPDGAELRDCCLAVRAPNSRAPHSLLAHCLTIRHVAKLYGVSEWDLRRELQAPKK